MTGLRALANRRITLIRTARATLAGNFDRTPQTPANPPNIEALNGNRNGVSQSHSLGGETMRLRIDTAIKSHGLTSVSRSRDDETAPVPVEPGARTAAMRLPPSWADQTALPAPGSWCACCHMGRWWIEATEPRGWRCWTCHPPSAGLEVGVVESRSNKRIERSATP
jgi:hypothetical protein